MGKPISNCSAAGAKKSGGSSDIWHFMEAGAWHEVFGEEIEKASLKSQNRDRKKRKEGEH